MYTKCFNGADWLSLSLCFLGKLFEQRKFKRTLNDGMKGMQQYRERTGTQTQIVLMCICTYMHIRFVQTLNHECRNNSKCGNLCSTTYIIASCISNALIMFLHVHVSVSILLLFFADPQQLYWFLERKEVSPNLWIKMLKFNEDIFILSLFVQFKCKLVPLC